MNILTKPLTLEEINAIKDDANYVGGLITVDLNDAIDNDLEGFLDIVSEKLVGSTCLMDVSFTVVGTDRESIILEVIGDVSCIINDDDEDEYEDEY